MIQAAHLFLSLIIVRFPVSAENSPVIVFVKSPRRGMVKSRLAASVGDDAALGLYTCFVEDTVTMLLQNQFPLVVFFHPAREERVITRWLGRDTEIFPQHGADLGERMKNAFRDTFSRGSTCAVLIGSDMPNLPADALHEAFAALKDHDVVLGPSFDGGYYLIGFRSDTFLPDIFDGISWSTPIVFEQTLAILGGLKYRVHILEMRRDIDTFDDLTLFFRDNLSLSPALSATIRYIRSHIPEISRQVRYERKV